jgi:hypothetical protein
MKTKSHLFLVATILFATAFTACKDPESNTTTEIKVTTYAATEITATTAQAGGHVTATGEAKITELGLCWGTEKNPATEGSHLSTTNTAEPFSCTLTDLLPETAYHIRAYAVSGEETHYGEDLSFTTLSDPTLPEGALKGLFSVSPEKQVRFSRGNLQYQASTGTWRFAESQTGCVGEANASISESYGGWIDLFAWGTSGNEHGAVCYQPWSTSQDNRFYFAYGDVNSCLYNGSGQADWGYNAISNGGGQTGQWRTLRGGEWGHLLEYRETPSGIRFAEACVDGTNGLLLFPDDWDASLYAINEPNLFQTDVFTVNTVSASDWAGVLEAAGVVFLPACGMRIGTSVDFHSEAGAYWASTTYNNYAEGFMYTPAEGGISNNAVDRFNGMSVRLVQDVEE